MSTVGQGISFSDYRHVAKYFAHKLNWHVNEPDESDDEFAVTTRLLWTNSLVIAQPRPICGTD